MIDAPLTSPELMEQLHNRPYDSAAWEAWTKTYRPGLERFFSSQVQAHDAADLTQSTCLKVISAFLAGFQYQAGTGRFRSWLGVVADRVLIDHRRRRRPLLAEAGTCEQLADHRSNLDDELDAKEERALFRRAARRVRRKAGKRLWDMFSRTILEEEHAADVAADWHVSLVTVYRAGWRVAELLREEVARLREANRG